MRLPVGHQHSRFWSILTSFVDYYSPFWGPKAILTLFVDYYSPFCGPEAISIVVEAQCALTSRSSTLMILADSGPFHGVLLTDLGSVTNLHD